MRGIGGVRMRTGICLALAAMAVLVASCSSSHSAKSQRDRADSASQLAHEDGVRDVARYRQALAELDALCAQDQAELAGIVDDTFRAELKQLPKRYRWDSSRLGVMGGFRHYELPIHPGATDPPSDCAKIGVNYLSYIQHDE
jgi:hypothetical protein